MAGQRWSKSRRDLVRGAARRAGLLLLMPALTALIACTERHRSESPGQRVRPGYEPGRLQPHDLPGRHLAGRHDGAGPRRPPDLHHHLGVRRQRHLPGDGGDAVGRRGHDAHHRRHLHLDQHRHHGHRQLLERRDAGHVVLPASRRTSCCSMASSTSEWPETASAVDVLVVGAARAAARRRRCSRAWATGCASSTAPPSHATRPAPST